MPKLAEKKTFESVRIHRKKNQSYGNSSCFEYLASFSTKQNVQKYDFKSSPSFFNFRDLNTAE